LSYFVRAFAPLDKIDTKDLITRARRDLKKTLRDVSLLFVEDADKLRILHGERDKHEFEIEEGKTLYCRIKIDKKLSPIKFSISYSEESEAALEDLAVYLSTIHK
jgi:ferredoxin-fold anticodon binding domain-containing protein